MMLDVGCGKNPWPNAFHIDIRRQAKHLEVLCDAHQLPFNAKVFSITRLNHVLEHLGNPSAALEEAKRVTYRTVIVATPNARQASVKEDTTHLFSWTANTFRQLLQEKFGNVQIQGYFRRETNSKMETAKLLLLSIISKSNELVAFCKVEAEK